MGTIRERTTKRRGIVFDTRYRVNYPGGKAKLVARTFDTRAEAEAAIEEHEVLVRNEPMTFADSPLSVEDIPRNTTLGDFYDTYYYPMHTGESARDPWKESTASRMKWFRRRILEPIEDTPVSEIDRGTIERLMDALAVDGLAPSTISNGMSIFAQVMNSAISVDLLIRNPALGLSVPGYTAKTKAEKDVPTPLAHTDILRVQSAVADLAPQLGLAVRLLSVLGIRTDEVLGLTVDSLDGRAKVLNIRDRLIANATAGDVVLFPTRHPRIVPVDDLIIKAIRSHKRKFTPAPVTVTDRRGSTEETHTVELLFDPVPVPEINAVLRQAASESGVTDMVTVETLRSAAAARIIERNFSYQKLADLLGDGESSTKAFERYGHFERSCNVSTREMIFE